MVQYMYVVSFFCIIIWYILCIHLQNELKAKWETEKSMLEKSKNEAEKKYSEINEQVLLNYQNAQKMNNYCSIFLMGYAFIL